MCPSNRNDLARLVADANDLDRASAAAIASTALMIGEIQSFVNDSSPRSSFDPACLILYPPSRASRPAEPVQQYLRQVARAAQADAENMACSSILAQGSESDDTGDVALWLGSEDHASPELVLGTLGLSDWAASGEVAISTFVAPAGSKVERLLVEMEDTFSFRVRAAMTGRVVLFFLIGRVSGAGWAGLAGIGTWS